MKIAGRLTRSARFEAPTCLVSIFWFSSAVAVLMGESAQNLPYWEANSQIVMLFCVAGVALLDFLNVSARVSRFVLCDMQGLQKKTYMFGGGAALWMCPSCLYLAGATLQTCPLTCIVRIAMSGLRKAVTICKFRGRCGTS